MTAAIVGLGLIGGSFALDLKATSFYSKITGVDINHENIDVALRLGLIDKAQDLGSAVMNSQLIIIATPVDAALNVLSQIMTMVSDQIILDVGSTKVPIVNAVSGNPKRGRFVATHPIWGTEYKGPAAALQGKLRNHVTVICNSEESDPDALAFAEQMYDSIGMKRIYMGAVEHDLHAAYVSHISHVTSFALALSVLEKEKETNTIFQLAGAGFESTVRLAKSNPDMWTPILQQNRTNILDVLNEQINQLKIFKKLLESEEFGKIYILIQKANEIKKIFDK